jgi:enterochelin esterase-like enzyme
VDFHFRSQPREELSTLYWIIKNRELLPRLRFDCGVRDPLIAANRILHEALQQERIDHVYEEFSGGHEWAYWQEHVQETLKFVNAG